jgi:DNA topoisomerase-1
LRARRSDESRRRTGWPRGGIASGRRLTRSAVASLEYVDHLSPGITRHRQGNTFRYALPSGKPVRSKRILDRIQKLAIPPAWGDLWIAPSANSHIQATGRDARGRLQYRYHQAFRAESDAAKFSRLVRFAERLPALRQQVAADMALSGMPRRKVTATLVRLLDITPMRIGNRTYARENATFGLTTLRNSHIAIEGSKLTFEFRGKSGKLWKVDVNDHRVSRIVRSCQELPGQQLFQYLDETGERHSISSTDVNRYLREVSGARISAKDFRTWAGTVLCAMELRDSPVPATRFECRRELARAVRKVADALGNTPAVCRTGYIHPHVLKAYQTGTLRAPMQLAVRRGKIEHLKPEEQAVLALLRSARRTTGLRRAESAGADRQKLAA